MALCGQRVSQYEQKGTDLSSLSKCEVGRLSDSGLSVGSDVRWNDAGTSPGELWARFSAALRYLHYPEDLCEPEGILADAAEA